MGKATGADDRDERRRGETTPLLRTSTPKLTKVLPMFPVNFVTYVPGCSFREPRLPTVSPFPYCDSRICLASCDARGYPSRTIRRERSHHAYRTPRRPVGPPNTAVASLVALFRWASPRHATGVPTTGCGSNGERLPKALRTVAPRDPVSDSTRLARTEVRRGRLPTRELPEDCETQDRQLLHDLGHLRLNCHVVHSLRFRVCA